MKKHEVYEGIVTSVKFPNKGVAVVDDTKCMIKNVLPGQHVLFRVTKKKSGMCEGNLLEITKHADNECEPFCRHFGECGGCAYQNLPYKEQLALKENQVRELIENVKGLELDTPLRDAFQNGDLGTAGNLDAGGVFKHITPSPVQFGYRNKMEFSFGDAAKDGELELGLHKKGSFYDIVTVRDCRIVDEDFCRILWESLCYFRGKETPYYHKRSHEGYLRHLIVRKAVKTGEILIDLVTSSQKPADTPCTEVSLLSDWANMLKGLKLSGHIVGILNTINDAVSDTVIDEGTEILYGQDYFYEEILGLRFKITPFSFFQTNSLSAEVLYDMVRRLVMECYETEKTGPVIFDLYSGTGTIAQLLSPIAGKVIGVEIVEEAVEAAKENAKLNGLHNCEFIAGDVLKVLDEIEDKPDFIVLDPPRDGINPKALNKIVNYGVDNIVYISCKPTSLARDLEIFISRGYEVRTIMPLDQFPGTVHVETCVLLCHQNVTKHNDSVF